MKNFLQVNRASTGAKKNFNFNFKHLLVLLAVLMTCINTAWGTAPSISPDTPGASGTVTFEDWTSLTKQTNYWKDGIKFYQYQGDAGISAGSDYFTTSTTIPCYHSNLTAGSNWGSYTMSGFESWGPQAFAISITSPSIVEIVLDNSKKDDPSLSTMFIVNDNVAYGTGYSSSSYKTGTDIKSRASITCVESGKGRYKIVIPVFASDLSTSSPYIIKMGTTSTSKPAIFVYESVTIKPLSTYYNLYQTKVTNSPTSPASASQSGTYYTSASSSITGVTTTGDAWLKHSSSGGYYTLTFSPALSLSGYEDNVIDVWWAASGGNGTTKVYLNGSGSQTGSDLSVSSGKFSYGSVNIPALTTSISSIKVQSSGNSAPCWFYIGVRGTEASCTDPGAATGLSRTSATGTSLALGWTAGSNADSYKVSLFTDAECTEAATSTEGNDYEVNTNSATFTGLSLNSTYYFKVQSVGDGSSYCEDGPWSSASGAVKTGVCNDYSFHYGTENADDWTTTCFTQVGSTSEWEVTDFTIPNKPNWYVGKYGFFYDDGMNYENAKSHTDAWSDLFFAASQGNGSGTRPKVGAATGATGRIRIYNNSSWNNLFASFEPDGYKLKFGSSTYGAFEADGSVANCYWSPLMTYNSTTASDLVSVGVIDGSGDYVATNNTEGMKHIFLHVGNTSTLWGKDSWSNFGLYDYTHTQFTCLMTKVPGETCLYEGWVPSTCTQVIFVRLKSSTPAWGDNNSNITDQTGCWTIPANTNMFTISSFSSGSWSAYEKSGQFRMWDNSTEKNWYVHFYPHNVLSYDGNGGSGSMTPQSVKVDAADQELTVAGNGFTREGWTFTGWNTEKHGGGTAYAAGDDIDVTEDITLYAQWERTVYFKVGAGWDDASAWYAIYYFDSSNDSKNGWVKLNTLADCETDVYKGTLPGNGYDKVIVCRMNPASSATNWDNRWNQTGNIDYPTTNVKFTPSSLDGNNCAGAWSAYSTPTFTISYAGGTASESGSKSDETKTCNVAFTLPSSAVFTRTGYTQTGWALTENGSQSHALGGSYTTNADQTFYPVWSQIMVSSIALDPTSKTLTIDETQTITPTVLPATALDKTITWTTSDADVATVDGGVVTAVGVGSATITATAHDGSGIYAECAITVEAAVSCSGDPTALVSGTPYKVEDMASACAADLYGTGQYKYGLSTNGKFYVVGTTNDNDDSTGTVEMKTETNENVGGDDDADFSSVAYLKMEGSQNHHSIKFVVPTAGTLTVWGYTKKGDNTGDVQIKPHDGDAVTLITHNSSSNVKAAGSTSVTAGTYYILSNGGGAALYGLKFVAAPSTYSITYNCDEATSGCPSDVASATNLPNPLPSGLTKTGYVFGGWYTNSTKTVEAVAGAALTGNTTLYAQWEDMEITLPGTLNKANNIEIGGGLTIKGDTLDYTTGGTQGSDGYAEWKVNIAQKCIYSVTINGNYDGSGRQWEMYLVNGSGTTVSTCTFVQKWESGDKSEDKTWDLSGIAATGTYIIRLKNIVPWGLGKVLSVDIDPIKVTYDANGGTCATEYAYYAGSALTLPTPTRDGYVFMGWYNGETKIGDAGDDDYEPTASITLTARWAIINDLPSTLNKSNYATIGGGLTFSEDYFNYGTGSNSHLDGYAEWKVNVAQKCIYKVILSGTYPNGHQWEVYLIDGSGSTVKTCTFDNSDKTGDRTEDKTWDLSSISATGTYTVRVKNIRNWGEPKLLSVAMNPITVTYNANGGSCDPEVAYYAGSALTLPTPTWSGYAFEGWYNAGTKIGDADDDYEPDPVASITLYAHWTDDISGKVFSYIDGVYGDKYKAFDASTWVTSDGSDVDKTYTNATTGVQFIVDNGYWDNKISETAKAISSLAKFKNGTTAMSVVIPTGKIATVKIGYGAFHDTKKDMDNGPLTIGGVSQTTISTALENGLTNAEVDAALKEVTLSSQQGTLTFGSDLGNIYIGRVSAEITGYVITYAAGDYGSGSLAAGTKTVGSNYTISSTGNAFTRTNCVYDGWSVNADGSTKDYDFGDTYSTDAALTLYPHWVATCADPAEPTGFSAGSITDGGVTFTITDDEDAGNYDIYYSTDDDAPDAETEATTTATAKSKAVTGLSAGTTYYAWVRAVCDEDHKSDWVALNPDGDTHTFFTDYTITIGAVTTSQRTGSTVGGTISASVSHAAEGGTVTLTATPTSGYGFVAWKIEKTSDNSDVTSSVLDGNTLTMPDYSVTVKATFATRYSITYKDHDKSTVLDLSPTSYLYGTGVASLPTPTKTGYTFDSWYSAYCVDTEHSGDWDAGCKKTSIGTSDYGSATYYASWTVNNYTLTWNLNGGIVSTAGTAAAVDETEPSGSVAYNTALTAPVVTKSGYDFAGWTPSVDDNMPAANTTYTAQWAEQFTVTYNAMTGSVDPTSATGSTANKVSLPEPTKDGYDFDGWYNTAGEKIGDAGDEYGPTAAITLYAKWQGSCSGTGTTIFKARIKTSGMSSLKSEIDALSTNTTLTTDNYLSELSGGTLTLALTATKASVPNDSTISLTDNGKAYLIGALSGTTKFQAGDIITVGVYNQSGYIQKTSGSYSALTDIPVDKRTTRISFVVPTSLIGENTFYIKGKSNGMYFAYVDVYRPGEVLFFAEVGEISTETDLGTSETEQTTSTNLASISGGKLYTKGSAANYAKVVTSHEISLTQANDGTYIKLTLDKKLAAGDKIIINTSIQDKPFGITTSATRSTTITVPYTIPAESGLKDQQTIYLWRNSSTSNLRSIAIIRPNVPCYQVTYNGNGATSGYTNDPVQYKEDDDPRVLSNGFTRTGYEFVGWNTEDDGSGTPYAEGATITDIDDDVTLYAQWRVLIDANNANFADYTSVGSTDDVRVANGATLTITENKTIHDLIIEPGATLSITSGAALSVNSLSLHGGWTTINEEEKYDMPRVYISSTSSLTKTSSTVNFDISVDKRNYYPFAVPFEVTVSSVDYVNTTLASASIYGTHYVILEYDGAGRAANGAVDANWTQVASDATLTPGKGYILTAVPVAKYTGTHAAIRFPMSFTDAWTTKGEQATVSAVTKNTVAVKAYEGTATEGGKNANKGWNMLGVPYMSCFASKNNYAHDAEGGFTKGKLNFITGEYTETSNVYVTVPTSDFSEYLQFNFDDADTKLLPGWCFFVQVDKDGTIMFEDDGQTNSSSLPIYAPKREQEMPTVKTGIILSSETASDKTTILVSDKYSVTDYEINADLEKLFGNGYTLATYSLMGETRLAYNAMSNSDATNVIPIGYRAPADGEYTFAINPRYAENGAFEHVNLIDYETGFVTDLLVSSYTFNTERTQNDERFALNVVKRQDVITNIGNGEGANGERTNGVQKVIINDKLYIIVDGRMYSAEGALVK